MARLVDVAQEAFANRNYQVAAEIFEQCLQDRNGHRLDIYFGYGDALARCGRIKDSFDVYAHICNQLGAPVPVDRLKHLSYALLDSVTAAAAAVASHHQRRTNVDGITMTTTTTTTAAAAATTTAAAVASASVINVSNQSTEFIGLNVSDNRNDHNHDHQHDHVHGGDLCEMTPVSVAHVTVDPLCCAICEDVLRCPVTTVCGHTFCRHCLNGQTQCIVCNRKFPPNGGDATFKQQDVLVLRLVEKWWTPEIRASKSNDEAIIYLHRGALDEALKACNESLEKCPNSYQGLLIRSEVLCRLNHFQSALADADNALKCRPTSYKAYQRRAHALAGLDHIEDALIAHCLAIFFNHNHNSKSANSILSSIRHDVAKLIHRLFVPSMLRVTSGSSVTPYAIVLNRRKNKQKQQRQVYHRRQMDASTMDIDGAVCNNTVDDELFSYGEVDHLSLIRQQQQQRRRRRQKRNHWKRFNQNDDDDNDDDDDVDDDGGVSSCHATIDSFIPRQNHRIRNLVDRINQEIFKVKRLDTVASNNNNNNWLKVNQNQIDLSDFECVLCYRTLWKPVVTPCGHTYCLVCLDRCLDYSSHCPLCKSSLADDYYQINNGFNNGHSTTPTSFSMSKKCVTRFLEIAMQRFIPAAYEKRQIQEIEKEPSVPVFICTTAFPYVPCPLFVYESRYRLMIRRAIESGEKQFGIAQPQSGRQRYTDFGTMLDIRDCVLLGNGCSILSTVGCRRFRVIARKEKDGYDTAKVEYIDDEPVCKERMQLVADLHAKVFHKAIGWYDSLPDHTKEEILKSFGNMPSLEAHWESITDGPAWAWYIIAILPLSQQLKVDILATTNLEKRLRAIDKTLEYVAAQKRRAICLVSCDEMDPCQAIDCCQRATSSTQLDEQRTTTTVSTITTTTATPAPIAGANAATVAMATNTTTSSTRSTQYHQHHHHHHVTNFLL